MAKYLFFRLLLIGIPFLLLVSCSKENPNNCPAPKRGEYIAENLDFVSVYDRLKPYSIHTRYHMNLDLKIVKLDFSRRVGGRCIDEWGWCRAIWIWEKLKLFRGNNTINNSEYPANLVNTPHSVYTLIEKSKTPDGSEENHIILLLKKPLPPEIHKEELDLDVVQNDTIVSPQSGIYIVPQKTYHFEPGLGEFGGYFIPLIH